MLLITGYYGGGKTTSAHFVLGDNPKIEYVKIYTTRPRREDDGDIEYRFVTEAEYKKCKNSSNLWDDMDSKIHSYNYGADVGHVNSRRNKGIHQISCIAPSLEIFNEMKNLYGGRVALIVINTPLKIANQRLVSSRDEARRDRVSSPYQTEESLNKLKTEAQMIFNPIGVIHKDRASFKRLVSNLVESF